MYIPPVVIPGRTTCASNCPACLEEDYGRYPPPPPYGRRRWPPRRRPPSPDYIQQPTALISTLLNTRRNIQIPPLPPPPPRPPRNIYQPIIQKVSLNGDAMSSDMKCKLDECSCRLNQCKSNLRTCDCELENCMYE